jgi:hypothetical protein
MTTTRNASTVRPVVGPVEWIAIGFPGPRLAETIDALRTELTELGELRVAGLLTGGEFAQQRARLLGAP